MKLKKLEIHGFKSFPEKTTIHFPLGISAVVGPNGCGKSNIVDAIRWVMGEQSIKKLRGKSMEDIIFAGTDGNPPLNMAEVSLTMINDNGSAPRELKDYAEIMLTRRLYRSGESSYLLNKRPCRLKDIQHVFLGSGLASKSYAIISQGNVGTFTEAGPEERRYFLEEAAGITRYKARKDETLRKIKQTHQNLLRVQDIISEIEHQLASLKRQVKKAERFKAYQAHIRRLDIQLGVRRHEEFREKIAATEKLIGKLRETDMGHMAALKKIDAAIESIKIKRLEKERQIGKQKAEKFETQRTADRLENNLAHLRRDSSRLAGEISELETAHRELLEKNRTIEQDIQALEDEGVVLQKQLETAAKRLRDEKDASRDIRQRLAAASTQLEQHKGALMDLVAREARHKSIYQAAQNSKENLQRRIKKTAEQEALARRKLAALEADQARATARHQEIQQQMAAADACIADIRLKLDERAAAFGEQARRTQSLELQRHKLRSQHDTLKKMQDGFEWYRGGVKAIMKRHTKEPRDTTDGIIGPVADILEPQPGFETAAEAVLGESLQYIMVADQAAGTAAIRYLSRENAGRSGFVPVASVRVPDSSPVVRPAPEKCLLRHMRIKPGFEKIADALLGHVAVCDDLQEALKIFNANGRSQSVVTRNGQVISRRGLMVGGSSANLSGILTKKSELRQLKARIETLGQQLAAARDRQTALESQVQQLENQLQQQLSRKAELEDSYRQSEKALYKLSEDLRHARRSLETVRLEWEQYTGEEMDIDDELERHRGILARIDAEVESAQSQVTETTRAIKALSSELETFDRKRVELQLEVTAVETRFENNRQTLKRLKSFHHDGQKRAGQLAREIDRKRSRRQTAETQIQTDGRRLADKYEVLKRIGQTLDRDRTAYAEIDAALQKKDASVSRIQSRRESMLEKIRLLELEQNRRQVESESIAKRLEESYHQSLDQLKNEAAASAGQAAAETAAAALKEELAAYRRKLERIGDVNLGAIGEYETLNSRHEFLSRQQEDLVKAIDDLHKVVRKINTITQKRFLETLAAVNQKLGEVFPQLFEDGTAKLVMTEPSKPLETGVEFMVHPQGKKLTRMSLLSGGEKALAAIAFIFSIFLLKPAAFCLMDEIDAPLDESNVYRFNNMLKIIGEKSQIIMVTHNKRSMEFADTLFGVTMEKRGISKLVSVNLKTREALN